MKAATVPPNPGIAPMMVPMTEPRSSTVQCLNTATTPPQRSVMRRVRSPSLPLATVPPLSASSIIWLMANMPVSVGTSGTPSHR